MLPDFHTSRRMPSSDINMNPQNTREKCSPLSKHEESSCTKATIEGVQQSLNRSSSPTPLMARISSLLHDNNGRGHGSGISPGSSSSNDNGYNNYPKVNRWRRRKLFGKSPWHRKASGESDASVSSSIRKILRGTTPHNTPESGLNTPTSDLTAYFPTGPITVEGEWSDMFPSGVSFLPPLGSLVL